MIMCGMSAAFSALFGTPLAAADFFHGSGQCRHHALFRTASLCHRITDRSRRGQLPAALHRKYFRSVPFRLLRRKQH